MILPFHQKELSSLVENSFVIPGQETNVCRRGQFSIHNFFNDGHSIKLAKQNLINIGRVLSFRVCNLGNNTFILIISSSFTNPFAAIISSMKLQSLISSFSSSARCLTVAYVNKLLKFPQPSTIKPVKFWRLKDSFIIWLCHIFSTLIEDNFNLTKPGNWICKHGNSLYNMNEWTVIMGKNFKEFYETISVRAGSSNIRKANWRIFYAYYWEIFITLNALHPMIWWMTYKIKYLVNKNKAHVYHPQLTVGYTTLP